MGKWEINNIIVNILELFCANVVIAAYRKMVWFINYYLEHCLNYYIIQLKCKIEF